MDAREVRADLSLPVIIWPDSAVMPSLDRACPGKKAQMLSEVLPVMVSYK